MLHVLMLHDAHACDAMHVLHVHRVPTIMLTSCIIIVRDDVACCVRIVCCVHVMQQHARVCG